MQYYSSGGDVRVGDIFTVHLVSGTIPSLSVTCWKVIDIDESRAADSPFEGPSEVIRWRHMQSIERMLDGYAGDSEGWASTSGIHLYMRGPAVVKKKRKTSGFGMFIQRIEK